MLNVVCFLSIGVCGGLSVCVVGVLGVVLSVRFVMREVVSVGVLVVR